MQDSTPALHPQVAAFLAEVPTVSAGSIGKTPVSVFREQFEKMSRSRNVGQNLVQLITNIDIPGPGGSIKTRLYHPPLDVENSDGPTPLIVYFHGGGHVVGSLDSHDSVARSLCIEAQSVVASVDYRLAPENKFPAALEDGYAATKWLAENVGTKGVNFAPLIVAGDSAGGNLAAVISLLSRDDEEGPSIDFQLLFYPVTDYSCSANSYQTFKAGFGGLTAERMIWFQGHYLPDISCAEDWRASPLKAQNLSGLPKTLIITAKCDVLHDEGRAYAEAMSNAGTDVEYIDWPGMIHGFVGSAANFDDGRAALRLAAARIRAIPSYNDN